MASHRGNHWAFHDRDWWTPTRGVRLPRGTDDLLARCHALATLQPDVVFSGWTAADIWGFSVSQGWLPLEVTRPSDSGGVRRRQHRGRRRDIPAHHITVKHGLRITTAERTFIDLAARLSLPTLVAFGDYSLRNQLTDTATLALRLADCTGQRGVRRARQALSMLDPRAESPRESMLRIVLEESGLPRPIPQLVIRSLNGDFIARGDLVYKEHKVVIEYDGAHHLTREQQASDADRRHKLALDGWLVVTVTPEDMKNPRRAVEKVSQALASRRSP